MVIGILIFTVLIESVVILSLAIRMLHADGTVRIDESDPDDVKMDISGVNVIDGPQKYFILKVIKYKMTSTASK
jgi:hypothetical protein